jgi:hypothetical protein
VCAPFHYIHDTSPPDLSPRRLQPPTVYDSCGVSTSRHPPHQPTEQHARCSVSRVAWVVSSQGGGSRAERPRAAETEMHATASSSSVAQRAGGVQTAPNTTQPPNTTNDLESGEEFARQLKGAKEGDTDAQLWVRPAAHYLLPRVHLHPYRFPFFHRAERVRIPLVRPAPRSRGGAGGCVHTPSRVQYFTLFQLCAARQLHLLTS